MAVQTTLVNKPLNPRGNDQSPLAYNRAKLFSGKALDFDGVNDKLTTPNISVQSSNVWTYSFYWNLQDASQTGYIFDARTSGVGYTLYYYSNDNNIDLFQSTGGNNFSTATFESNQWYHIALSSNGTNVGLYINGQFVENIAGAIQTYSSTGDLFISSSHSSSVYGEHFLSNFKAFDVALTAAQVADLYNNPEKIVPTGVDNTALKLWLPMQEGAGTTALNGAPDALGSELVTNGDFATDSDWAKATGWTISGGKANSNTSAYRTLAQNIPIVLGKKYKVFYDVVSYTSGSVSMTLGADSGALRSAVGSYSEIIEYNTFYSSSGPRSGGSGFVGSIDNVSVKELTGFGTISGATWTHGIGAPVAQTSVIDWNKHTLDGTNEVLVPQGLTSGRDLLGNLFENVRKQGALNLDGNSWAEVHDNESLDFGTGSFTLEAWIKVDAVDAGSSFNAILSIDGDVNNGTGLAIITSLIARIEYDGNNTGVSTLTRNDWAHLVGTFDGTNATFYVNGVQDDQDARTAADITNANVKYIGRDTTSVRQYHNQIAQPRIYNRALTAEEVQRNYNAGKNTYTN